MSKYLSPALLAALFAIIYCTHSLQRHFHFNSHALDLGIHAQAIYLFNQSIIPFSSILHFPYLADHFGLILFFLSPIYKLFPYTETILILQALAISISGFLIYLIAIDKLKSTLLTILFTISFLASPAILSAIIFDFHLATISVFPLSLILFAWHFQKWRLYIFSLFLAITFKEDVQVFILGLGIYQLFCKKFKLGILTIIFALLSFYLIKFVVIPFVWKGADELDINTSILPLTSPVDLLSLFIARPTIFLDQIFNSSIKLDTIDFVYRQFAFLSILSPLSWLTILPALFLRFSSTATHFWGSIFHYNANLTPFLAFSAISAVQKFKLPKYPVAILLVFFLITGGLSPNSFIWSTFNIDLKSSQNRSYINNSLKVIPQSAAVSAQSPIVPHLTNREKIYMFPEIYDAEYIVLDTSLVSYPLLLNQFHDKLDLLNSSPFWKVVEKNKTLIIFKKN